jgi:hypothetical protein
MWREEYTSALRAIFEVIPDTFTEEAAKFLENGLLDALGAPFGASKAARKLFHEHISEAYMGGKKEFVKSSTSLSDHRAINVLTKHNCFWLGQHYGEHIGPNISELTRRALDTGVGRKVLAEDLKAALGGAAPADYNYWDVAASSALVRGRSFGFISGMAEAELEYYEVLAMMDERMCPICGEMNGRVFSVAEAQKTINSVLNLTDPAAFKAALPWQTKPPKGVDNKTLMNEGKAAPPFHGRCRCTLIAAVPDDVPTPVANPILSDSEREKKIKELIAAGVNTDQDAIAIGDLLYDKLSGAVMDASPSINLRDAIIPELSKYRKFGGTPRFVKGSQKAAKLRIEEVSAYYPTAWLNQINSDGGILAKGAARARGYHLRYPRYHKIALSSKGTLGENMTAHHEMAHAAEYYSNVRGIEKQFYHRRTLGEPLEKLKDLMPGIGYRNDEVTKKDKFATPYMGKDYKGRAYEVLSSAMEGVFYNRYDMWHKDPESIKMMIGVLLGV